MTSTGGFGAVYRDAAVYERLTADGIQPVENQASAVRQAIGFVEDLLALVRSGGHLLVLMFDPDTAEPQLVNGHAVHQQLQRFVDDHAAPSGRVHIPTGVHVSDFQAAGRPEHPLPEGWPR